MATKRVRFKGWHCADHIGKRQCTGAPEQGIKFTAQRWIAGDSGRRLGHEHPIGVGQHGTMLPKVFAHLALDAIAAVRKFVHALGHRDAQSGGRALGTRHDVQAKTGG